MEKDALFAQLIDSDFAGGVSDNEGFVVRVGYAPVRNWVLNATYFLNKRNVDVPNALRPDRGRLQPPAAGLQREVLIEDERPSCGLWGLTGIQPPSVTRAASWKSRTFRITS